mgnify:CR=1 FL=1
MVAPVLIELREVRKRFGGHDGVPEVEILHGIDLRIRAGEYVAIVGASGSGKTTLMNILGCLDRPSSGEYLFQGEAVSGLDDDALAALRREVFGFVFQGYHLIGTSSALDNVAMPARYAGVGEQARHERAAALLSRLGLAERLQYLPHQLSGGQQQRVSIARALVNGGRVILADEPTGALDSTSGEQVMQQLDELSAAGHTLILITHDPAVAARARRIISMADGRIVGDATAPVDGKAHASPATGQAVADDGDGGAQGGAECVGVGQTGPVLGVHPGQGQGVGVVQSRQRQERAHGHGVQDIGALERGTEPIGGPGDGQRIGGLHGDGQDPHALQDAVAGAVVLVGRDQVDDAHVLSGVADRRAVAQDEGARAGGPVSGEPGGDDGDAHAPMLGPAARWERGRVGA